MSQIKDNVRLNKSWGKIIKCYSINCVLCGTWFMEYGKNTTNVEYKLIRGGWSKQETFLVCPNCTQKGNSDGVSN